MDSNRKLRGALQPKQNIKDLIKVRACSVRKVFDEDVERIRRV